MAIGDVFKADFLLEGPDGPASFGIHYRESVANVTEIDACRDIAEGIKADLGQSLLDILASDWKWNGIRVSKRSGDRQAVYVIDGEVSGVGNEGLRPGVALPANNAVLLTLQQEALGARHNGKVYIPGLSETDTNGSKLTSGYKVLVDVFAQLLELEANSPSDAGEWQQGVISQKHLIANPGDWNGAFLLGAQIISDPFIAIQRRRTGRRVGYAA